ncbi:CHAP domain-containing protein [Candidatus Kaiserbacteria bacterium]|nr:CHAP domain-containing protein [Candidatus Kaiserbacteria bacterium]
MTTLLAALRDALAALRKQKSTVPPPAVPATPASDALHFTVGEPNPADSPRTIEVRRTINDMYGDGKWGDALQCTEYVTYRIKLRGIDIQWPVSHGRNGGKWAAIFKAAHQYTVLSDPQPHCAMCFTTGISSDSQINAIGHVAFVEEVLADGSVRISESNWPHDGIYNERIIPRSKWQDQYQAQFVSFG